MNARELEIAQVTQLYSVAARRRGVKRGEGWEGAFEKEERRRKQQRLNKTMKFCLQTDVQVRIERYGFECFFVEIFFLSLSTVFYSHDHQIFSYRTSFEYI